MRAQPSTVGGEKPSLISLSFLIANKNTPRLYLDGSDIDELAVSIDRIGLLEAIIVRPVSIDTYEIVCGHRRALAVRQLGWTFIPAIVRGISDADAMYLMLETNIKHKRLTDVEEARALSALADKYNWSPDEIRIRLGKSRNWVMGRLNLAKKITPAFQESVITARLLHSEGRHILSAISNRLPPPES